MYVSEHKLICRNDRKDFIPHIVDGFQPLSVSTSVASINNNENNNNNDVREKLKLKKLFLLIPPSKLPSLCLCLRFLRFLRYSFILPPTNYTGLPLYGGSLVYCVRVCYNSITAVVYENSR